jgi:hypothetical protein
MADNTFLDRIVSLQVFQTKVGQNADGSLRLDATDPSGKSFLSRLEDGTPGFRIRFKIDKIIEVTPNPTSLWIYNLGADSRALFEQKNNTVILSAGYGNNPEVIFRGNVSRCRTSKAGPDYITHIEAADGLFAVQNSRIDQAFSAGARQNQVINTLVGALKSSGQVNVGEIRGISNDGYNQGLVLSGSTVDQLRQVCEKGDLDFTIEDGKIYILPYGDSKGIPAIVISANTGMVGIPEKRDVGISVKSLLNPKIGVFQKIIVQSKFINGLYTTAKVSHSGDSHGGDYYTEMEAA